MKTNRYIEPRENGVAVVDYCGSSRTLVASFEKQSNGEYLRKQNGLLNHCLFNSVEEIRTYYGIPLRATVYYVATEDKDKDYNEIPQRYEIELETKYNQIKVKQYPITVNDSGEWLVSDKLLRDIAALKNTGYDVCIMY